MLDKIVYAGTMSRSFEQASKNLRKLAEVEVPTKQVERVCQRIGNERVAERDEAVEAYQALPLSERKGTPAGVTAPELAVVGCDGGRLQILERSGANVEAEEADVAEEGRRGQHWREDKIGLLQTMQSTVSASDPCPDIPACFVDPPRILKLTRELKKRAAPSEEAKESSEPERTAEALAENSVVYEPPEVLEKRFVGYHSKYNPIERCWSALERKWNGVLLTTLQIVLECALRMCWKDKHPKVEYLAGAFPDGIRVTGRAKKELEARLERSPNLRKYDITIRPRQVN